MLDGELERLLATTAIPNAAEAGEAGPGGVASSEASTLEISGRDQDTTTSAGTSAAVDPFARRREEAKALLLASAPRPSAAEVILYDLASREIAIYVELSEAQETLARELHQAVHGEVRGLVALGKVLREVTQVSGAISRRVEHLLGTATSLRAQRRFLELHRGADET
jgi:hypothetical protein